MLMFTLLCLVLIGIIVFSLVINILKSGKTYSFIADEKRMQISTKGKKNKFMVINYKDVIGIEYYERKFPFLGGLTIRINTEKKLYEFRYSHSRLSEACGISETPFNIICERSAITAKLIE